MSLDYSDGAAIEREILVAIQESKDRRSSTPLGLKLYSHWPLRYHLCPERSNLFRHLNFQGLDVLELGAGMGGASRFVAEQSKTFTALEGTQPRLDCLRARLADLNNWDSALGNIQDFHPDRKFDVICVIGVLEYAELYIDPPDGTSPHLWLLQHAVSMLRPGGALVLAIENQFGLKYWSGAPEDHTGRMFDGIAGYPSQKSPRTFARAPLLSLLSQAGLPQVKEFYPWPDYKTPHSMISHDFAVLNPKLSAWIAGGVLLRDSTQEVRFFPESLALESAADANLLSELANSFLFVASSDTSSPTCQTLLKWTQKEGAWHYNVGRRTPICTAFEQSAEPTVEKHLFSERWPGSRSEQQQGIPWRREPPVKVRTETPVSALLRRFGYFGERDKLQSALQSCIRAAIEKWSLPDGTLSPEAFDATISNAVRTEQGFDWFDLEWVSPEPISISWFVLRNVLTVWNDPAILSGFDFGSPAELYESLCTAMGQQANLDADLLKEAKLQTLIVFGLSEADVLDALKHRIHSKVHPNPFPKSPSDEVVLRADSGDVIQTRNELAVLRKQNEEYRIQMSRRVHRMANAAGGALHKIPGLMAFVRSLAGNRKA